jgi:hypothetical protein
MARACSAPVVRLPGAAPETPGIPHALAIPGPHLLRPARAARHTGAWATAPFYRGSCVTSPDRQRRRGQKPGRMPPLPVGLGLGDVEEGVTDGDGEAPFWTKMVMVAPFGSVALAAGC